MAGLIIGALARLIMPGKQHLSIFATLLLGLAGSVIGGVVANLLGTGDIFELNVLGFIVAVIAALALIGVAEADLRVAFAFPRRPLRRMARATATVLVPRRV